MAREGQDAMLILEMFKESDVSEMATKTYSLARAGEELKQDRQAQRLKDLEGVPEEQKEPTVRILVPVEGTPECEIAIPLARQLASAVDAEICLVRVVVVVDAFSSLRSDPEVLRMMDGAARYLAQLESRFELPEDRVRPLVRQSGNAAKEIITIAENEGIDLIIMASRCKGWLQRLVEGSVCSEVIRSRVCPVLCVPLRPAQVSRRDRTMATTRR